MKQKQIQAVRVHFVPSKDGPTAAQRINQFHVRLIERRLNQSGWGSRQKIQVIDRILQQLAAREATEKMGPPVL